jgi:hypothetical protein
MPNPPMAPLPHSLRASHGGDGDGGAFSQSFLDTIREVAVFAWGVVGINGSLEQYRRGKPTGEALPMDGVHIWDPLLDEKKVEKPDLYSNIDLVHEEQEHDGKEEENDGVKSEE